MEGYEILAVVAFFIGIVLGYAWGRKDGAE